MPPAKIVEWYKPFYDSLPMNVKESYCKCEEPSLIAYSTLGWVSPHNDDGFTIEQRIHKNPPIGMYCKECSLPAFATLYGTVRACEQCGTYYVPVPAKWTYPIKTPLCPKHHVISRRETILRKKYSNE